MLALRTQKHRHERPNAVHVWMLLNNVLHQLGCGIRLPGVVQPERTKRSHEGIVSIALTQWGRVDYLVNTAGFGRVAAVHEMTEQAWDSVIAVCLKGTFLMVRQVLPTMIAQGSGVILNTSSDSGTGDYFMASYAAAKEGIIGLTRSVAREVGRYGIRCNAIRPRAAHTGTSTEATWAAQVEFSELFGMPMTGTHRFRNHSPGKPEEVAAVALWLCSSRNSNVNGRTFEAGGGEIGLWSEPEVTRSGFRPEGWDLSSLEVIRDALVGDLRDERLALPEEAWRRIDSRRQRALERIAVAHGRGADTGQNAQP